MGNRNMTILDYDGQPSVETDDKERIATLTRKGWKARPEKPACGDGEAVQWDGKAWQVVKVAMPPIERVATAALLIVLRKRGLREQFDSVCTSLPPEQQEYVKEMLQMPYTRRDHPLVEMLRQAFGFTPEQTDELFAEADAI